MVNKLITLDNNKCIKCGLCYRICPMQINVHKGSRNESLQLANDDCIKCRSCVENCPVGALSFMQLCKSFTKQEIYRKKDRVVVEKVRQLSSDTREILLKYGHDIETKAGQFILIEVEPDLEIFRAYSIVEQIDSRTLKIAIKIDLNGLASGAIYGLKKGDRIYVEGPYGQELTLKNKDKDMIFYGIGIGITPFVGLSKEAVKNSQNVILYHSAKKFDELIYYDFFNEIRKVYDKFEYIPTLTRETKEFNGVHRGRITGFFSKDHENKDLKKYDHYICGNPEAIKDIKKILNSHGVEDSAIFSEGF